jgi:hypothetical protein
MNDEQQSREQRPDGTKDRLAERTDYEQLQERAEQEADELEQRGEKVGENLEDVRQEWKRKRSDPGVPGANPPDEAQEQDEAN